MQYGGLRSRTWNHPTVGKRGRASPSKGFRRFGVARKHFSCENRNHVLHIFLFTESNLGSQGALLEEKKGKCV
jgi:hypothetical protein